MLRKYVSFCVLILGLMALFATSSWRKPVRGQAAISTVGLPSTVLSGMGTPTANNLACSTNIASVSSSSFYIQRDLTGNNIWKCQLGTDGVTYAWQAPAQSASSFNLAGTSLGSLRCAYGMVTTSTSGTASVSYSGMAFTSVYWVAVQSVASTNTAAASNNASVSGVTTTGMNIAVTTPTTISILGLLTLQLTSAATPVYISVCGV